MEFYVQASPFDRLFGSTVHSWLSKKQNSMIMFYK